MSAIGQAALALALQALENRGLRLGPPTNTFTGNTPISARNARDAYATANPSWLADYDGNENFLIRIVVGTAPNQDIYWESRLNGAWNDVERLVQGPRGATGARGPAGQDGRDGTDGTDGRDGTDAVLPATATQAEIEAGVVSSIRMLSPLLVRQGALAILSDDTPINTSTASAGTANEAARSDHDHGITPGQGGGGGGEQNVQADWTETDTASDAYIRNKPTIPTSYPEWDGSTITSSFRIISPAQLRDAAADEIDDDVEAWAQIGTSNVIPATRIPTIEQSKLATGVQTTLNNAVVGPISTSGSNIRLRQADGSNLEITDDNITDVIEAGGGLDWNAGIDNKPIIPTLRTAAQTRTLLGLASTTQSGLLRQLSGQATQFLRGDGTWAVPPSGGGSGEVNVQADWDVTDSASDAFIRNKPNIPTLRTAAETRTLIGAPSGTQAGLVPALPSSSQTTQYLRGDGTWHTVQATGGGAALPAPVYQHIPALVSMPIGSVAGSWGVWTEIWRYTNSRSTQFHAVYYVDLNPKASWTTSSGGDRAGADFRATVHSSDGTLIRTLQAHDYAYIRTGPSPYNLITEHGHLEVVVPAILQPNEYLLIEGRGAAQVYAAGRSIQIAVADFDAAIQELIAAGGAGEDNVQADWDETDTAADSYIQNKPNIPTLRTASETRTLIGAPSSSQTGLVPQLPGNATNFLRSDGTWAAPPAGTGEANVQADWNESSTSSDAFIRNKPNIPTLRTASQTRSLIGDPTTSQRGLVPALPSSAQTTSYLRGDNTWAVVPAQQQVDWDATTGVTSILNKPSIPTLRTAAETRTLIGDPSTSQKGLVPQLPSTDQTTKFLRADGTWEVPAGGGGGGGTAARTLLGSTVMATSTTISDSAFLTAFNALPSTALIEFVIDTMGGNKDVVLLISKGHIDSITSAGGHDQTHYFAAAIQSTESLSGTDREPFYSFAKRFSNNAFSGIQAVASWALSYSGQTFSIYHLQPAGSGGGGGGETNVQSDWDETNTNADAYIRNKPSAPTTTAAGLVPQLPSSNQTTSYLRGDGTWVVTDIEQHAARTQLAFVRNINTATHAIITPAMLTAFDALPDSALIEFVAGDDAAANGLKTQFRASTTLGSKLFTKAFLDSIDDQYVLSITGNVDINLGGDRIEQSAQQSEDQSNFVKRFTNGVFAGYMLSSGIDLDIYNWIAIYHVELGAAAANVAPLSDQATAVIGTSDRYARQDHRHPTATGGSSISTHTRYSAASTDTTFAAADFTQSSMTDSMVIPTFTANSYIGLAIPNDEPDLTFIRNPGGINQVGAFTKQSGTLTINSVVYKWWRSNRRFLVAQSGRTLEFGSS